MKGLLYITGLILTAILIICGFAGCDEDEVLPPEEFAPPTNLKALSLDQEVRLFWTAAPAANADYFAGYRILTKEGNVLKDSTLANKQATSYLVTGNLSPLQNGHTYTFSIRSVKTNGDVSNEVTIQWGPTQKFGPVRIYEFDSQNPSGLQFSTGAALSFTSANPDNRNKIDLWIDGRNNSTPLLKSPDDHNFASTGWRNTKFKETSATSLTEQVDVPSAGAFTSTALTISANKVFFARTQDGNYVRFTVSAVSGTAPNRYVDVTYHYNEGTGAWAKR